MTDDETAKRLYETPAPAAKPAQDHPAAPKADADPSSKLYDKVAEPAGFEPNKVSDPATTPRAQQEQEAEQAKEDALYGEPEALASEYAPALADSMSELQEMVERAGLEAPSSASTMSRNHAEIFSDARLPPPEAARLHALMVSTLRKGPIDAQTMNEWTAQSMAALREKYGEAAEAKLAACAEFVRNRPDLATIMRTGLGSHPDIVLALAGNAHNLRMKPRARKK